LEAAFSLHSLARAGEVRGFLHMTKPGAKRTITRGKRGRPTKQNANVRVRILEGLRDGRVMRELCGIGDMPDRVTIYAWMAADPAFKADVARAREEGADALVENALAIADEVAPVSGDVAKARLRADMRMKIAAAYQPGTYGNRSTVQINSAPPPLSVSLTPAQLVQLAQAVAPVLDGEAVDVTPRVIARPSRTPHR
jgi:hypothetical protein